MADPRMNRMQFAMHCKGLYEQVCNLLGKEEMPVQVQVLLSNLFAATEDVPSHEWAPMLATFLAIIGQRDGVYFNSWPNLGDDDDDDEEATWVRSTGETQH